MNVFNSSIRALLETFPILSVEVGEGRGAIFKVVRTWLTYIPNQGEYIKTLQRPYDKSHLIRALFSYFPSNKGYKSARIIASY